MRRIKCALLSISALMLSSCVYAPRISAHTPLTLSESSARFNDRIQARFSVGSAESTLIDELRREHFKIQSVAWPPADNPDGFTDQAIYKGSYYIACEIDWNVAWRAETGRIAVIHASYGDTCL